MKSEVVAAAVSIVVRAAVAVAAATASLVKCHLRVGCPQGCSFNASMVHTEKPRTSWNCGCYRPSLGQKGYCVGKKEERLRVEL